ncbi:MAG: hypothetical protein BWZ04_03066 [Firmicutes bacterium ADurb.BinA205]|nr:MAG: hypothetical protein BWZ04_03066 [Firmicutes bacterium ADurb.BinA205]
MRTVYISSGIVIIIGAVINVSDCSLSSFCPNGALAF